jgi:hypothetical protein
MTKYTAPVVSHCQVISLGKPRFLTRLTPIAWLTRALWVVLRFMVLLRAPRTVPTHACHLDSGWGSLWRRILYFLTMEWSLLRRWHCRSRPMPQRPQVGCFDWCGNGSDFNTSRMLPLPNQTPPRWWCAWGMVEKTSPCGFHSAATALRAIFAIVALEHCAAAWISDHDMPLLSIPAMPLFRASLGGRDTSLRL